MSNPRDLCSRRHRRGQVINRGATRLLVCVEVEDQRVSIGSHLVRVVPR